MTPFANTYGYLLSKGKKNPANNNLTLFEQPDFEAKKGILLRFLAWQIFKLLRITFMAKYYYYVVCFYDLNFIRSAIKIFWLAYTSA